MKHSSIAATLGVSRGSGIHQEAGSRVASYALRTALLQPGQSLPKMRNTSVKGNTTRDARPTSDEHLVPLLTHVQSRARGRVGAKLKGKEMQEWEKEGPVLSVFSLAQQG